MFATMKFLHLNFIPRSSDAALLLLRVWYGAALVLLHGWGKMANYSAMASGFPDPFGIGKTPSLMLVIFAEVICATLIVLGVFTRAAALVASVNMASAFWFGHGAKLTGKGNDGELAFLFLGVFLALLIAGAGKFSFDAKMGAKA